MRMSQRSLQMSILKKQPQRYRRRGWRARPEGFGAETVQYEEKWLGNRIEWKHLTSSAIETDYMGDDFITDLVKCDFPLLVSSCTKINYKNISVEIIVYSTRNPFHSTFCFSPLPLMFFANCSHCTTNLSQIPIHSRTFPLKLKVFTLAQLST